MKQAFIKWKNALPLILSVMLAVMILSAAAVYFFEPVLVSSEMIFAAKAAPTSLAADLRQLTRLPDFRDRILEKVPGDGRTWVITEALGESSLISVRVIGPDPRIVTSMAQTVGESLKEQAVVTFGASSVSVLVSPESAVPCSRHIPCKSIFSGIIVFVIGSIAAFFFGSSHVFASSFKGRYANDMSVFGRILPVSISRVLRAKEYTPACSAVLKQDASLRWITLKLSGKPDPSCITALTGPDRKSTQASALLIAHGLTACGLRVLLFETDPMAQLKLVPGIPHLSDYFEGRCDLNAVLSRTAYQNLFYVDGSTGTFSGPVPDERFLQFMDKAGQHFDQIVLSMPVMSDSRTGALVSLLNTPAVIIVPANRLKEADLITAERNLNGLAGSISTIFIEK